MDKELEKRALEALERQKKQYKRQNDFIKNKYERYSLTLPIGTGEKIRSRGETVNGLINKLVKGYLEEEEK